MPEQKTVHIAPPWRIEYAGFAVLVVLALFLLVEAWSTIQSTSNPTNAPANTITVSGTGQASVAPDIAHITFSVQQQAASVADAQAAATTQANAAIAYVKGQGVADSDITTLSYDISPQYSYANCPPGVMCPENGKITGYQVSETIQITVHDLTKVSALLQGLGQQNVENISGPDFGLANPNEGTDAARALAIANAKQEAQTLAAQLGVSLGRIVSFNENGGPYPVYGAALAAPVANGSAAAAPVVPAGENQYSSSVSITYEIH